MRKRMSKGALMTGNILITKCHFIGLVDTGRSLLMILNLILASDGPCEIGWKQYKDHCYLFNSSSASLPTAFAECDSHAATLLSIEDKEENDFIS